MDVWLNWLRAFLDVEGSGLLLCSLPEMDVRLLPTGCRAESQKSQEYFVLKYRKSLLYFSTVTGEVSAHLFVTPRLHLHVS